MQHMLDEGIATRRGIMCAHLEPAYAEAGSWRSSQECKGPECCDLKESERAQKEGIILPLFSQMTDEQQARVASVLRDACSRNRT